LSLPTAFDVLNLADAGFPTGAHGHSGGLEYAVQAGWVTDRATFQAWCVRALAGTVLPLDLRAARKAWALDPGPGTGWRDGNADLASFRPSRLQREASAQVGRSFLRSVRSCYGARADDLPLPEGPDEIQFPVAWGLAFRALGLPVEAMADTLVFGALRQWTQVAVRIVPLGQNDAFAAQTEVLADLGALTPAPDETDRPLESWAPGLELASVGMENLERKYFRS